MFSPAQLASGDLSTGARTLIASTGERTFGLAFNAHDAGLPIAPTMVSASAASHSARAPRAMAPQRAAPPEVHVGDGSRPGSVLRR
jgi:hypothetical protein